jgi:hypothetical protein
MSAGKGDKNRVSDLKAYRESPLWDNMKNKKYDSYTEFSNDFNPVVEECVESSTEIKTESCSSPKFLFLDDDRVPQHAYIWEEDKTLSQVSGISNFKWDIVRSYDEFVAYITMYGIPKVVSFDNDLWIPECDNVPEEQVRKLFQMIDWESSSIKTGAHCAAWLCERCKDIQHPLPTYYVHSANALARPIIKGLFETARPLIKH